MRLTLQQMIHGAIAEAQERTKLAEAEAEDEKGKEPPKETSAEEKKEEKEEDEEKEEEKKGHVSSGLVQKVASALDFINSHLPAINWVKVAEEPLVGAGKGETALPLNEDGTPGTQNYVTGQATSGSQPPMKPGEDPVGPKDGQLNAASSLETDMNDVPGGTGTQPQLVEKSSSVRRMRSLLRKIAEDKSDKEETPEHEAKESTEFQAGEDEEEKEEKKKEKVAFSLSEAGHKLDAAEANAMARAHHEKSKANKEYANENPAKSHFLGGQHMTGTIEQLLGRHQDYVARKHEDQRNAYNPFGGMATKSRKEDEAEEKKASIRLVRALCKQAEDEHDGNANIRAGSEPLVNPNASASEENVPKLPGAAESQRDLIDTLERAINYDKGDAKAEPKRQMGQVLDEPAQKKSTDPVLQNNLDATGQAGVKISHVKAAAARAYLRKIAEAGEREDATLEEKEKAEKLKAALEAKKKEDEDDGEKEKAGQFGTTAGAGMSGGGASSMATPGMGR